MQPFQSMKSALERLRLTPTSRREARWERERIDHMRDCASSGCRCHDPFWCPLAIEERMAAARRAGLSETLAALGGPFVVPDDVPGDALSVDRWLTGLARG